MLRVSAVVLLLLTVPLPAAERVDFAHDILPLLRARCAECHTNGKYKGGLSFDTRAALVKTKAVIPGRSAEGALLERITSPDPEKRMPPKGPALTAKEVALLRAWVDQGVPWQDGFSFVKAAYVAPLKPRRPELPKPPAAASKEPLNPIDLLIANWFEKQQLTPPPPLDDAAFLRRLYLDVNGLLPTPEQLDAFVNDTRPDKRTAAIRQVLGNNRAYAEHWLTFWNDLLRNDYQGTGFIDNGRKQITTWLYRALLENKPYDQFVRELIAPKPDSEGFIKGIKWRGVVNASQVPEVQFSQNISQVFLGINMKCASCHDSFIDSWKLDDAYALAAVVADKPLEIHRCDKPTGVHAKARFLWPELGTLDPTQPREERLRRLAELLTHPDNGRFTRTIVNRLWQRLMGRGLVHPVDVMGNEPWNADLLDFLATHLVDNKYDLKKTMELIVSSRLYQSQSVPLTADPASNELVFRGPLARRMTAEQFQDAIWQLTATSPAKPVAQVGERGREPVRASLVVADPLMRSLGRPNREQVVTTRPEDLSTLQALDLTNGRRMAELLDQGAKRLRRNHPDWSPEQLIDRIYLGALSRRPTSEEAGIARQLLGTPLTDDGLSDLLWAVFLLPEFQLIR